MHCCSFRLNGLINHLVFDALVAILHTNSCTKTFTKSIDQMTRWTKIAEKKRWPCNTIPSTWKCEWCLCTLCSIDLIRTSVTCSARDAAECIIFLFDWQTNWRCFASTSTTQLKNHEYSAHERGASKFLCIFRFKIVKEVSKLCEWFACFVNLQLGNQNWSSHQIGCCTARDVLSLTNKITFAVHSKIISFFFFSPSLPVATQTHSIYHRAKSSLSMSLVRSTVFKCRMILLLQNATNVCKHLNTISYSFSFLFRSEYDTTYLFKHEPFDLIWTAFSSSRSHASRTERQSGGHHKCVLVDRMHHHCGPHK